MSRNDVILLLESYVPSLEEIFFKNQILAFIKEHEDCFERSLECGHITASAWLMNKDGSKALLMHHAKLDKWVQLGGHCDGDSDVLGVAVREAQEESGIGAIKPVRSTIFDIDVHFIPANSREKAHYHYDIRFLLRVFGDEDAVANNESKELRWVTKLPGDLPTQSPSVLRMFNKWREQTGL